MFSNTSRDVIIVHLYQTPFITIDCTRRRNHVKHQLAFRLSTCAQSHIDVGAVMIIFSSQPIISLLMVY